MYRYLIKADCDKLIEKTWLFLNLLILTLVLILIIDIICLNSKRKVKSVFLSWIISHEAYRAAVADSLLPMVRTNFQCFGSGSTWCGYGYVPVNSESNCELCTKLGSITSRDPAKPPGSGSVALVMSHVNLIVLMSQTVWMLRMTLPLHFINIRTYVMLPQLIKTKLLLFSDATVNCDLLP